MFMEHRRFVKEALLSKIQTHLSKIQTQMNGYIRTTMLLAAITALFVGAGYLMGGQGGMMIALVLAIAMNAFAYWNADKMVLRMHRAREVDARTAPQLYGLVQRLAHRGNLPMPRVYIVESDQPNAFATGRDPAHAAVAATTGLLRNLSQEEIAGVMAHELAHVKNRDTLIMTITATIAGAISMLANFALFFGGSRGGEGRSPLGGIGVILVMFLAPVAAMLVQMAISRTREYEADRIGAEISAHPEWLASALAKIHAYSSRTTNPFAERNPATAHMYISNPLHAGGLSKLFSTHPPMEERIKRLRALTPTSAHSQSGPWG